MIKCRIRETGEIETLWTQNNPDPICDLIASGGGFDDGRGDVPVGV